MKGTIRFFTGFIITFIVGCIIDSDMTTKEMSILTKKLDSLKRNNRQLEEEQQNEKS